MCTGTSSSKMLSAFTYQKQSKNSANKIAPAKVRSNRFSFGVFCLNFTFGYMSTRERLSGSYNR